MEIKRTVITICSHSEEEYIKSTNTTDITHFRHYPFSVSLCMHRADMITLMPDGIKVFCYVT